MDKIKARRPRGFNDVSSAEQRATARTVDIIRTVYERYGFDPVETPTIEYTDALGKFLPDQDRPNDGVFSFRDDDEQWLSLRYDLTAPLARHVAEINPTIPYRSYRSGWVFRNEKPGPGRFRQFMQFDADTVGSASPAADAEMCMMAADTMDALGLSGRYVVRLNSRKALDDVLREIGANSQQSLIVLRAIDKMDRLGIEGVAALLGAGRMDDSGDFTAGALLSSHAVNTVLRFVEHGRETPDVTSIMKLVDSRVCLDSAVVRGLEYYTGAVYEVQLDGAAGSVGGGGRYDGLVSRFRGQPVPATGFSVGVSRLVTAMVDTADVERDGPVVVLNLGEGAWQMAQELRAAGVRAEMYLGNPKHPIGQQLKYADRRRAPFAIICGENERREGVVLLRDLRGEVVGAGLDRDKYREKAAARQEAMPWTAAVERLRRPSRV